MIPMYQPKRDYVGLESFPPPPPPPDPVSNKPCPECGLPGTLVDRLGQLGVPVYVCRKCGIGWVPLCWPPTDQPPPRPYSYPDMRRLLAGDVEIDGRDLSVDHGNLTSIVVPAPPRGRWGLGRKHDALIFLLLLGFPAIVAALVVGLLILIL